jgi:hypothetical protein
VDDVREIALPSGTVRVGVPSGWGEVEGWPGVLYLARADTTEAFAPTVSVVLDRAPLATDPVRAAGDLAVALEGGTPVDASPMPEQRGWLLVVAHRSLGQDVVTVQAQLPVAAETVAVSYACSATQAPAMFDRLRDLAADVSVTG